MAKLSTFLWFDNQAEEAATLYTSLFADGRIVKIVQIPLAGKDGDKVMKLVEFEMNGHTYSALDGGPLFKFNESILLVVHCDTQKELDYFWSTLTADGGREVQCGWLKDRFGISWQIVPSIFPKLMGTGEGAQAEATMRAVREMVKFDIGKVQRAYDEAASPVA